MLRLSSSGMHKNVSFNIAGLENHHLNAVPPAIVDFFSIASYLFIAERMARFSSDSDTLPRSYRLIIGVHNPDFWSSREVSSELEKVLRLLIKDTFSFEFKKCQSPLNQQLCCITSSRKTKRDLEKNDAVVLLSGGLDSLGGAANSVLGKKQRAILVSHRASNLSWKIQDALADALGRRPGILSPAHVSFRIVPCDNQYRKDRPQCTGALLYAAMAGVIAAASGVRKIYFPKNGVCSLGFSASRQKHRPMPQRTTHPQVLFRLSRILSLAAGFEIGIENPFEHKTRSEIVKIISTHGLGSAIRQTVTCTKSPFGSPVHHCGTCDACIDRRFAMLASGLETDDADYQIGLKSRLWERKPHRRRLLCYIAAAEGFATARDPFDFFNQHGTQKTTLDPNAQTRSVCEEIFELHKRHGQAIGQVVSRLSTQLSQDAIEGRIQTHQSLILLTAEGLRKSSFPPRAMDDTTRAVRTEKGSDNIFLSQGDFWTIRFKGRQQMHLASLLGFKYVQYLLRHPAYVFTAYMMIEIIKGRPIPEQPLAISLSADDRAVDSLKKRRDQLTQKLEISLAMGDNVTAGQHKAEILQITRYLRYESGLGGKSKRENKKQKNARDAVSNAIRFAIGKISVHDRMLAEHLNAYIETGFFLRYRCQALSWET